MDVRAALFDHIADESRILDELRKQLPTDATVEDKQAMRDDAARLAAEATRRRVGVPMAAVVLNELAKPVMRLRTAQANGRPARDVLAPKRRRSRSK